MALIELHVHVHGMSEEQTALLHQILAKETRIMATQAELLASLTDLNSTVQGIGAGVDKVGTETQTLVQKVADLEAAIANAGGTTPEVDAALAAVKESADAVASKVKAVDDLVPDAPATP